MVKLLVGGLGDPDVHAVGKSGASALFNKEAQTPSGIIGRAEFLDSAGGFFGQLNHNSSLRKSKRVSKRGMVFHRLIEGKKVKVS